VSLKEAEIYATNFQGLDLSKVEISDSVLAASNFINTDLSKTRLDGIDLSNKLSLDYRFEGPNFSGQDFSNRDLSKVIFSTYTDFVKKSIRESIGYNANFSFSNLSNVDLRGKNLSTTIFKNADLSNTNLSDTNLRYSDFTNANLEGANLEGAMVDNAILDCFNHPICN